MARGYSEHRAGHTTVLTTELYVREAEAVRQGIGDLFNPVKMSRSIRKTALFIIRNRHAMRRMATLSARIGILL
jgi:hypothetical protein